MSSRGSLVALGAALAVVLLVLLSRGPRSSNQRPDDPDGGAAPATKRSPKDEDLEVVAPPRPPGPVRAVTEAAQPPVSRVRVFGLVTSASEDPGAVGTIRLVHESGRSWDMPVPLGEEYEFLGIPPGHVEVSATGFRRLSALREGHRLPAVPEQRIDLRLLPLWNVAVSMRAPDGTPFRTAFRRGFWPSDGAFPRIVLTRAPPSSADLRDADQLPASTWSYTDDVAFEGEDDARTGSLVGSAELPAWASACLGDRILDTRLLPPGSVSLELVLDPGAAEACRGSVSFRVLDSTTGLPILDTYGFAISEAAEGDGREALLKLWPEGVSRAKDLPPGRHTLVVQIPGYEYVRRTFATRPGELTELGDLLVGPARAIQGHVRDESGQPITVTPAVRRVVAPFERLGLGDSQDEGWFVVTALPDDSTLTLTIENGEWAPTPRVVHLAGEDLTDLDLIVRRGLPVVIEREGEEPRRLRLLTPEGLFVWEADGTLREYGVRLEPGRYEATSGFDTPRPKSLTFVVSADSLRFLY